MLKWLAGGTAVAVGLAIAMAFSSSTPAAMTKKGDRLDIRTTPLECPKFEWPYGCAWDAAKNKRAERAAQGSRSHRSFRNRAAAAAKVRRLAATRPASEQASARR
jgi:hypothetical protein